MKHVKHFNPEIGDYVICEDNTYLPEGVQEFIENSVGEIVHIETGKVENPYCVKFKDIPKEYLYDDVFRYSDAVKISNCRWFKLREIKFHSRNEEELRSMLDSKKYNI